MREVKIRKRVKRRKVMSIYPPIEWYDNPRNRGILAKTPTPCSCYMCGSYRITEGPTIQERRNMVDIPKEFTRIVNEEFWNILS